MSLFKSWNNLDQKVEQQSNFALTWFDWVQDVACCEQYKKEKVRNLGELLSCLLTQHAFGLQNAFT